MRLILAAILLLQPAPAQSEADKLEAALKKFGERSYRFVQNGKDSGTLKLANRIEKDGDRKVVVFEDRIVMKVRDFDVTMALDEKASLDGLRLISATRKGKAPGGDIDWRVSVDSGKAATKVDDREQTIDVPARAVGELAVMRLVCAAEQKEGATFKLDVLSLVAERVDSDHAFRCLGKETIEINGKKVDAFKWEQKGEWKITREIGNCEVPETSSVDSTYWVSPEGYLVQKADRGVVEFVLDAK